MPALTTPLNNIFLNLLLFFPCAPPQQRPTCALSTFPKPLASTRHLLVHTDARSTCYLSVLPAAITSNQPALIITLIGPPKSAPSVNSFTQPSCTTLFSTFKTATPVGPHRRSLNLLPVCPSSCHHVQPTSTYHNPHWTSQERTLGEFFYATLLYNPLFNLQDSDTCWSTPTLAQLAACLSSQLPSRPTNQHLSSTSRLYVEQSKAVDKLREYK